MKKKAVIEKKDAKSTGKKVVSDFDEFRELSKKGQPVIFITPVLPGNLNILTLAVLGNF